MSMFIYLIAAIWSLRILGNLLTYVQWWWVKEYRFDRMFIHLATFQGRRFWAPHFRRPPVSPKTILLTLLAGATILGVLFLPLPLLVNLFIADIVSFPLTFGWVFLLNLPVKVYHVVLISLAVNKLRQHPMLVIGITGSYGKTSTKEYLATILSQKYKVLKTTASQNSPIAIAETILRQLRPKHQVFVVEMGAYKRGEIAKMAAMVRPQVGIVTAINPQHQDLFKTLETTMYAKYELIAGLAGQRIAILNADDPRVKEMGRWAKRDGLTVWWWSTKKVQSEKRFIATNIKADLEGVEFVCVRGEEKVWVRAPVLGQHQVGNILAAIAASVASGMTLAEAAAGAAKIAPVKKVMEKVAGPHDTLFINDTFNNNPDAAIAALRFLDKIGGRKFLIFQPMIELGRYAQVSHEEVGALAGQICEAVILTNRNFYESFERGLRRSSQTVPLLQLSARQAANYLEENLRRGDTVLFKGKETEPVLNILIS